MWSAILPASSGCERPATIISRLPPGRSMKWPPIGCVVTAMSSRPGSRKISVGVAGSADIPLLRLLARAGDRERPVGDVVGHDRASGDPCVVADRQRRHEAIVDAGPDVAADRRAALRAPGLMREV